MWRGLRRETLANKREKKPTFPFYIVNRRELDEFLAREKWHFGDRGMHCGEAIRQATIKRPYYGTSSHHAFCKASHGASAKIPYAPALYAVIPAPFWQRMVLDRAARIGSEEYVPTKRSPQTSATPSAPRRTGQLSFEFIGNRIRLPMPKRNIFGSATSGRSEVALPEQLTLQFAELDR